MSRTHAQRRTIRELNEKRTYASLAVAFRYAPVLRWCLMQGYSQRDIRDYFNERGFPVPSRTSKPGERKPGRPKLDRKWSLIQIQRLLRNLETLALKMKWRSRHSRRLGAGEPVLNTVDPAKWASYAKAADDSFHSLQNIEYHRLVNKMVRDWWSWTNAEPYRPPRKFHDQFRALYRPTSRGFRGIMGDG